MCETNRCGCGSCSETLSQHTHSSVTWVPTVNRSFSRSPGTDSFSTQIKAGFLDYLLNIVSSCEQHTFAGKKCLQDSSSPGDVNNTEECCVSHWRTTLMAKSNSCVIVLLFSLTQPGLFCIYSRKSYNEKHVFLVLWNKSSEQLQDVNCIAYCPDIVCVCNQAILALCWPLMVIIVSDILPKKSGVVLPVISLPREKDRNW